MPIVLILLFLASSAAADLDLNLRRPRASADYVVHTADGDPVDAVELSASPLRVGSVTRVRMVAALAKWFGVDPVTEMAGVLPNIVNFGVEVGRADYPRDLGFMA